MNRRRACCICSSHRWIPRARSILSGAVVLCLWPGSVTLLQAQANGVPLAAPLVHELRTTVPALSRATLNAPRANSDGTWLSSIDAVTNVTMDVLLLPPDPAELRAGDVQIMDVDGVLRRWSDEPIVVARMLTPGRHTVAMRWECATLTDIDCTRVAAGMRTVTRRITSGLDVAQAP